MPDRFKTNPRAATDTDETPALATLVSVASLIEALPDALVVIDGRGMILLVNSQTEWITGRPRADMIGNGIEMLLPEKVQEAHVAWRAGYMTAPEVRSMGGGRPTFLRHRNGVDVAVDINLAPMMTASGMLVLATVRRKIAQPGSIPVPPVVVSSSPGRKTPA